jgi:hypothetical protein
MPQSDTTDPIKVIVGPPVEDIKRFIEAFDRLSSFEAQSVAIRGYGAFGEDWGRPDPAVIRVLDWLKETSNEC